MTFTDPRIANTMRQIVNWLVVGEFSAIEKYTTGARLSATLLRQVVFDYGKSLIMPPASVFEKLDVIPINSSNPQAWSVRVDLWTKEEGRSDLSLECTLIDGPGALLAVEIDNLHVL